MPLDALPPRGTQRHGGSATDRHAVGKDPGGSSCRTPRAEGCRWDQVRTCPTDSGVMPAFQGGVLLVREDWTAKWANLVANGFGRLTGAANKGLRLHGRHGHIRLLPRSAPFVKVLPTWLTWSSTHMGRRAGLGSRRSHGAALIFYIARYLCAEDMRCNVREYNRTAFIGKALYLE